MSDVVFNAQPISPEDALLGATSGVPNWVIVTINTMVIDAMLRKPDGEMSLKIEKRDIEATLSKQAEEKGCTLRGIPWENFPYIFAKKWNIKVPPVNTAGLFGYDTFYTFIPKGITQ